MGEEIIEKFDLKVVHDNFESSLHEEDDIILKHYLESFEELNKFFNLIGTVFSFVSKDIKSKMDILNEYLNDENNSHNFHTVKKMILYEKENALINKKGYVSGSRTLLRLHRGLDFIRLFLEKIGECNDDEHLASVCREAYDNTLAKYHPFIIRNGAKIAMYTLPNRGQFLKKIFKDDEAVTETLEILSPTLNKTSIVYERIENIYTVHDLHTLP